MEVSWSQKQVLDPALKVKMEFSDVKQKPNSKLKQIKRLKAEKKQREEANMKQRMKSEKKQKKRAEKAELKQRKKADMRMRHKKTLAEVSCKDKQMAEKAIEELQGTSADLTCCLCDPAKTFTAYTSLLYHHRRHSGYRPFKCDQCRATFTRQHSLNYHLMTHKNWSRYTCPQPMMEEAQSQ